MRRWIWTWVPALLVIAVVGFAYWHSGRAPDRAVELGTPTPGPVIPGPKVSPDNDTFTAAKQLVRDLSDGDANVRAAARMRLASLGADQNGTLRVAARDVTDPDLRRRIDERLAEMDEQMALNPPPVSLHVQGERLAEVLSDLNGQLGTTMDTVAFVNMSHPTFSLEAEKLPFWEIMTALNQQHPIYIADMRSDKRLFFYDGAPGMENPVIQGSFIFYTRWLPPPERKAGEKRQVSLGLVVAADPRLHVFELEETLEPVKDELGHELRVVPRDKPALADYHKRSTANGCPRIIDVELPDDAGGKIVSLKERVRVVISLGDVETDLEDAVSYDGKTIVLGNTTVEVSAHAIDPDANQQTSMNGRATSTAGKPHVIYTVHDPAGTVLIRWGGNENSGSSFGSRPGPYKVHVLAAQKTRELNLDFELRNLAIPPG